MDQTVSPMMSEKAKKTANRYTGDKASEYLANRRGTAKWQAEDRAVRALLNDVKPGTRILDIPCGTGRFFPLYEEKQLTVTAVDISPSMLAIASGYTRYKDIDCTTGNIFGLGLSPIFDATLCIRFMNLIEAEDVRTALAELQRVTLGWIAFTLRVGDRANGHYHHPYPLELIQGCLKPGWHMSSEPLHEHDYHMVRLWTG